MRLIPVALSLDELVVRRDEAVVPIIATFIVDVVETLLCGFEVVRIDAYFFVIFLTSQTRLD